MSLEIPVAFRIKFHEDFIMLAQQGESRLENRVRRDPDDLQGKFGYFDRIGAVEMSENFTRHSDTVITDTPHSRRRIGLRDFDLSDLVDKKDMRRFVNGGGMPARYAINGAKAAKRKKDDLIIAAATGNAFSIDENDAATNVALPASQIITAAATGLTLAKIKEAKKKLDQAEVEEEGRVAVVNGEQMDNLLSITQTQSIETSAVKSLVDGKIDHFMGFDFVRSERLLLNSGGERMALFFQMNGLGLAMGQDMETDIGPRRDKRNSIQVFIDMAADSTRIEDERVVQVNCVEV